MFCILDTSSVLNCSPRSTREELELSNFLLPSCWASVPLGGFVPNRIENEVVLATKCMLENEKRFDHTTPKSRAWVFHFIAEHFQVPKLQILISLLFLLSTLRMARLEQCPPPLQRGAYPQEPNYSQNLC